MYSLLLRIRREADDTILKTSYEYKGAVAKFLNVQRRLAEVLLLVIFGELGRDFVRAPVATVPEAITSRACAASFPGWLYEVCPAGTSKERRKEPNTEN